MIAAIVRRVSRRLRFVLPRFLRPPSLRSRMVMLTAIAVAFAVVLAASVTYFLVRAVLIGEVDGTLTQRATQLRADATVLTINAQGTPPAPATDQCKPGFGRSPSPSSAITLPGSTGSPNPATGGIGSTPCPVFVLPGGTVSRIPPTNLGDAGGYTQFVRSDGSTFLAPDERDKLPVDSSDLAIASGHGSLRLRDAVVKGVHVRIATAPLDNGYAIQISEPLTQTDNALSTLRWLLSGVAVMGIALAVLLGRVVGRSTIAPVKRLMQATERVAGTQDFAPRLDVAGNTELDRLAASFNRMLDALEDARRGQRQLVADASHELRTPLASLRTNLEVLARDHTLGGEERSQLLHSVLGQLERLSTLVADVVTLARGDEVPRRVDVVRLADVVGYVVGHFRLQHPGIEVRVEADASTVLADGDLLARAVSNLLDNAAKWNEPGSPIELRVCEGEITVCDHGPGIADDDLPRVFDRFWRAPSARSTPGSGLGLAIVRQVAESMNGTVSVERATPHGTRFHIRLPTALAS